MHPQAHGLEAHLGRGILGNRTRGAKGVRPCGVFSQLSSSSALASLRSRLRKLARLRSPSRIRSPRRTRSRTSCPARRTYDITTNARGVFHVTAAGIDEEENFIPPYHVTGTVSGTFVAVPSDGTGPTFTGRFTDRFGETEMITHSTGTTTFFVQGRSSDGSRVSFHLVTHYTITGTGVEFGFEKPSC